MALTVTHKFISQKVEQSDPTIVGPNEWNATHLVVDSTSSCNNAGDYNFTPIAPGGTLTGGVVNTIVLPNVPLGVNGTDQKHYLYINSGAGTGEAVLIIGGTAISGGTNQTLIFTPVNSYSGAWTIGSATAGIAEAAFSLPVGNTTPRSAIGKVCIPPGTFTIYGAIPIMQNCSFSGAGKGVTSLVPATNSTIIFDANLPPNGVDQFHCLRNELSFTDFTIDGTAFNSVNTIYGIRSLLPLGSTTYFGISGVIIQRVCFININYSVYFHRSQGVSILDCELFGFSTLEFTTPTPATDNPMWTFEVLIDNLRYDGILPNGIDSGSFANPIISGVNMEDFTITNSIFRMRGGTNPEPTAISIAGFSERITIDTVTSDNAYYTIIFNPITIGGMTQHPGFICINNVAADQMWGPAILTSLGTAVTDIYYGTHCMVISNCQFTNPVSSATYTLGINLQPYTNNVVVTNCLFLNWGTATTEPALSVGDQNYNINIEETNMFVNDAGNIGGTSVALIIAPTATNIRIPKYLHASNFGTGISDTRKTLSTTATITLPTYRRSIYLPNPGTVTAITALSFNDVGYRFTLFFGPNVSVTKGGTLHLSSNYGPTVTDGSLTLEWNGAAFFEVSRCVN